MGLQRRHKSSAGRSILIFCFGALTLGQWSTPLLVIRKEHTKYSFFFSDCHYIYIFGKLLTFEKHFEVSIRLSTFLSSCHMICARLLVFQSNLSFRWVLEYLYLSSVSTSTTMMLMGIVPVFSFGSQPTSLTFRWRRWFHPDHSTKFLTRFLCSDFRPPSIHPTNAVLSELSTCFSMLHFHKAGKQTEEDRRCIGSAQSWKYSNLGKVYY